MAVHSTSNSLVLGVSYIIFSSNFDVILSFVLISENYLLLAMQHFKLEFD